MWRNEAKHYWTIVQTLFNNCPSTIQQLSKASSSINFESVINKYPQEHTNPFSVIKFLLSLIVWRQMCVINHFINDWSVPTQQWLDTQWLGMISLFLYVFFPVTILTYHTMSNAVKIRKTKQWYVKYLGQTTHKLLTKDFLYFHIENIYCHPQDYIQSKELTPSVKQPSYSLPPHRHQ